MKKSISILLIFVGLCNLSYALSLKDYHVYWLHGLNDDSSFWLKMSDSFKFLEGHSSTLSYDSNHPNGAYGIASQLSLQLPKNKDIILVGHSAGGLIARHLAMLNNNVVGVITVGSPNVGAPIVQSAESQNYIKILDKLISKANTTVSASANALVCSAPPLTTIFAPLVYMLQHYLIKEVLADVRDFTYNTINSYVSPFYDQQLFKDLKVGSGFINNLNQNIDYSYINIAGAENSWQLFRLIGSLWNYDEIKQNGISQGYDEYLIDESGVIYEVLNKISCIIHGHNVVYDVLGYVGIIMPWLYATRETIMTSRRSWEGLERYINIGVHTDWAEMIGAYHTETINVRMPIYDYVDHSVGDGTVPGIIDQPQEHTSDMGGGEIGYTEREETVYIYDPHDGIISSLYATIPNSNQTPYLIQGLNHLEMGALDTPMKDIISNAIKQMLRNNGILSYQINN